MSVFTALLWICGPLIPIEVNSIAGLCHQLHVIPFVSQEAQRREMLVIWLLNQG